MEILVNGGKEGTWSLSELPKLFLVSSLAWAGAVLPCDLTCISYDVRMFC